MKNIIKGSALIISLLAVSCTDFLVEDPKGQMVAENYFASQSDLDGSVNVLYEKVQYSVGGAHNLAPNWMGDDLTTLAGGNKDVLRQFDAFDVTNNNADVEKAWSSNYLIIKAANFIIENADRTPVSQEEINIAMGQALFWRSVAFFKLVRWFGEIPLVLSTDVDYNIGKSSVEAVYEQICTDLENAVKMLPTSYDTAPRILNDLYNYVNKGAAQAVLAAVYMARAGYPLNQTEYYEDAAKMAKAVIDGVANGDYYYKFEASYADKFKYATNNYSKETVVGVQFNKDNPWGWSGLDSQHSVCQALNSVTNEGWGDAVAEIKFFKDMPEGPRKDAIYGKDGGKIFVEKGDYKGQKIDWYQQKDGTFIVTEAQPMFRTLLYGGGADGYAAVPEDYSDDGMTWGNGVCDQTLRLVSYGEVLLWYAEASARSGSVTPEAQDCLQKILDRAYGAGKVNAADYSGEEFAEKCMTEHGYEVAGYYPALVVRANDQLRMNTLKDHFTARTTNAPVKFGDVEVSEKVTVSGTWSDSKNYSVYPAFDTNLNPGIK